METPSSSKCRESSLAFARGLRWWRTVAARLDFCSAAVTGEAVKEILSNRSIRAAAIEENEKP
jgi:hypothetical protein